MRRLHPEPAGPASLEELYGVTRRRVDDRPFVGVCMIASLDGSTVVAGRSGGLSSPTDSQVLGVLREHADVIIVGAATVREEGYGRPKKHGQRIGVVTSTGDVDPQTALFTSGAGFLIMPEDGPDAPGTMIDTLRAGTGRVDLTKALRRLDRLMEPPTFVQAEGGPRLNGSLLDAGCVDELNLTISPTMVGGGGPRLSVGAADTMDHFELAHLAVDDDAFIYSRWLRRRDD